MEMNEVQQKRPPVLLLIVVAVVAVVVAVFIVIQAGRMRSRGADAGSAASQQMEQAERPEAEGWPAPEGETPEAASPAAGAREVQARETGRPPVVEAQSEARRVVEAPPPRETRRVEPADTPEPTTRDGRPLVLPTSDSGRFVIQVGSYKDERLARVQAKKMAQFGYTAWVETADIPGKGRYYRIRIGGFDRLSDARRVAASMEEILQNHCWVDQR